MSFFEKLKNGMSKTRKNIAEKLNGVFAMFTRVDEELLEELEETLILCDMGVNTAMTVIEKLRAQIKENRLKEVDEVKTALKEILYELVQFEQPEEIFPKVVLHGKPVAIGAGFKFQMGTAKRFILPDQGVHIIPHQGIAFQQQFLIPIIHIQIPGQNRGRIGPHRPALAAGLAKRGGESGQLPVVIAGLIFP